MCLLLPTLAAAQAGVTIQGVVVDESKLPLPGVTITVADAATGRLYTSATDERGEYRVVNVPAGTYDLRAELTGFTTVAISRLEVLVGQNTNVPITMSVGSLQETVTVRGETPLVNIRASQVATNIDRRQMEALPLQGRNWMELALMSKGVTANSADNTPGVRERDFNLNLDGVQIIQNRVQTTIGQPKFSREAIAEFQLVTNLFDVTQGRSTGVQVQAITRSGTNTRQGALYGYFRDDALNAPDPIVHRVVPYQNGQFGGALGGPVIKDKLLYFFTYEYEREPQTLVLQPPALTGTTFIFPNTITQHSMTGRVDQNISSRDHITYRASNWTFNNPFYLRSGATTHPSAANVQRLRSTNGVVAWSRVLSDNKVQEIKLGFNGFYVDFSLLHPAMNDVPTYSFPGLSLGGSTVYPQWAPESTPSARYDLTWHKSEHDFKLGGEFLYIRGHNGFSYSLRGEVLFTRALTAAEYDRRFPTNAYDNPAAWDLTGLDSNVRQVEQNVGSNYINYDRPLWAAWFGDTWRIASRLTLNYGIRWDTDLGVFNPPIDDDTPYAPFNGPLFSKGQIDWNNVAPRVGFTYDVTGKADFVIRGGSGLYYNFTTSAPNTQSQFFHQLKTNTYVNDGAPGFLANYTRNYSQAEIEAGNTPQRPVVLSPNMQTPYAVQTAIGFQKQLGPSMAVDVDLTHLKESKMMRGRDINLFFNPETGYNLDPIVYGRPDPNWGEISWLESTGRAENLLLSTGLTRRFKNHFQGGVSYTYTFYNKDNYDNVIGSLTANNMFDLDGEWSEAEYSQKHTLRVNGIFDLPWGLNLAALGSFGSGTRYATRVVGTPYNKPGGNRLNIGAPIAIPENLLDRFDGPTVIGTNQTVPRNALIGLPIYKVDLRLTKSLHLGRAKISGIGEVFNVFNHANYGSYNTQVNSATFGQPVQNQSNTYRSRTGQLALRLEF